MMPRQLIAKDHAIVIVFDLKPNRDTKISMPGSGAFLLCGLAIFEKCGVPGASRSADAVFSTKFTDGT